MRQYYLRPRIILRHLARRPLAARTGNYLRAAGTLPGFLAVDSPRSGGIDPGRPQRAAFLYQMGASNAILQVLVAIRSVRRPAKSIARIRPATQGDGSRSQALGSISFKGFFHETFLFVSSLTLRHVFRPGPDRPCRRRSAAGVDHAPNKPDGICLRELFHRPDDWQADPRAPHRHRLRRPRLDRQFTDEELGAWLPMIERWGLKFMLEVGAIKPWGVTGARDLRPPATPVGTLQRLERPDRHRSPWMNLSPASGRI
jgi:hypothetical protein